MVRRRKQPQAPPAAQERAKDRILAAALSLFCEKGFDATSVREISERARVTKPVLYYYYRSKENLFRAILERTFAEFRDQLEAVCSQEFADLASQLNAIAQVYVRAARTDPALVRFIHSIAFSGVYDNLFNFREAWMENMERLRELFEKARKRGLARKDLSPAAMAFYFNGVALSMMRGIAYFPELVRDFPVEKGVGPIVLQGIGARR